ncbi:MAG: hypothetical protein AAF552_11440, partial [Pseudomonadota bacterium]
TSNSGLAVWFNVPAGEFEVRAGDLAPVNFVTTALHTDAGVVTLVDVWTEAVGILDPDPGVVNFEAEVMPMFAQSCTGCHGLAGRGGLSLAGLVDDVYVEVTQELSVIDGTPRVDLANPELSLMITMPALETPPDSHPNAILGTSSNAGYQTLMTWIQEGALNN